MDGFRKIASQQTKCSLCGKDGRYFFADKPETKYCLTCKKSEIRSRNKQKSDLKKEEEFDWYKEEDEIDKEILSSTVTCFICKKRIYCECKGNWYGKHDQPCLNRREGEYPRYVACNDENLPKSSDGGVYFGHVCSKKCAKIANVKTLAYYKKLGFKVIECDEYGNVDSDEDSERDN